MRRKCKPASHMLGRAEVVPQVSKWLIWFICAPFQVTPLDILWSNENLTLREVSLDEAALFLICLCENSSAPHLLEALCIFSFSFSKQHSEPFELKTRNEILKLGVGGLGCSYEASCHVKVDSTLERQLPASSLSFSRLPSAHSFLSESVRGFLGMQETGVSSSSLLNLIHLSNGKKTKGSWEPFTIFFRNPGGTWRETDRARELLSASLLPCVSI